MAHTSELIATMVHGDTAIDYSSALMTTIATCALTVKWCHTCGKSGGVNNCTDNMLIPQIAVGRQLKTKVSSMDHMLITKIKLWRQLKTVIGQGDRVTANHNHRRTPHRLRTAAPGRKQISELRLRSTMCTPITTSGQLCYGPNNIFCFPYATAAKSITSAWYWTWHYANKTYVYKTESTHLGWHC